MDLQQKFDVLHSQLNKQYHNKNQRSNTGGITTNTTEASYRNEQLVKNIYLQVTSQAPTPQIHPPTDSSVFLDLRANKTPAKMLHQPGYGAGKGIMDLLSAKPSNNHTRLQTKPFKSQIQMHSEGPSNRMSNLRNSMAKAPNNNSNNTPGTNFQLPNNYSQSLQEIQQSY